MGRLVAAVAFLVGSLAVAVPVFALFHVSEINEAMSGAGGVPALQYVEIRMLTVGQNLVAHSRLTYFDCTGTTATVLLEVPTNVANQGANVRWLMASESTAGAFLTTFGVAPDFTFPAGIDPTCGNVCWGAPGLVPPNPPTWDAADPNNYVECLAYGGYSGPTKTGAQRVVAGPLGDGTHGLTRSGTTFALACPTPQNNAGVVGALAGCPTSTTTTTLPFTGDAPISGTKLVMKDDPADPTRRVVIALSRDAAVGKGLGNGSVDDPTLTGGSLRIVSTAGDTFDDTYPMPAAGWTRIGKPGQNIGYRYRDPMSAYGPVRKGILKAFSKVLKVTARGSALGHTLGTDPRPVDVAFTVGTQRFCQHYGGTIVFRAPKSYTAKLAYTSPGCPP